MGKAKELRKFLGGKVPTSSRKQKKIDALLAAKERKLLEKAQAEARKLARVKQKEQSMGGTINTEPRKVVLDDKVTKKLDDKKPQDDIERGKAAVGNTSAMLTKPGLKPLSLAVYRSLPTSKRVALGREAKKAYDAGTIDKSTYETIIDRIDAAELSKVGRAMEQGRSNKRAKPVTLSPAMDFSKGGSPMKAKMPYGKSYNKGGYANCGASVSGTQGRGKK